MRLRSVAPTTVQALSNTPCRCVQEDKFSDSYISTIGVDFVSLCPWCRPFAPAVGCAAG